MSEMRSLMRGKRGERCGLVRRGGDLWAAGLRGAHAADRRTKRARNRAAEAERAGVCSLQSRFDERRSCARGCAREGDGLGRAAPHKSGVTAMVTARRAEKGGDEAGDETVRRDRERTGDRDVWLLGVCRRERDQISVSSL